MPPKRTIDSRNMYSVFEPIMPDQTFLGDVSSIPTGDDNTGTDADAIHDNVSGEITAITASDITLDDVILYEKASTGAKGSSTFGAPFTEQVVVITGANETAFPTFTGINGQEGCYNNKYYRCVATDTWVRWAVETA